MATEGPVATEIAAVAVMGNEAVVMVIGAEAVVDIRIATAVAVMVTEVVEVTMTVEDTKTGLPILMVTNLRLSRQEKVVIETIGGMTIIGEEDLAPVDIDLDFNYL